MHNARPSCIPWFLHVSTVLEFGAARVEVEEYFDNYKIFIDGRWSLEDLYRFPRAYEQVYFAIEAMLPASDEETEWRLQRAFRAYPWQGGYSAVN